MESSKRTLSTSFKPVRSEDSTHPTSLFATIENRPRLQGLLQIKPPFADQSRNVVTGVLVADELGPHSLLKAEHVEQVNGPVFGCHGEVVHRLLPPRLRATESAVSKPVTDADPALIAISVVWFGGDVFGLGLVVWQRSLAVLFPLSTALQAEQPNKCPRIFE